MIESLEIRRLLTYEFLGTSGDDTVGVQYVSNEYRFTLNGSPAGATQDPDVIIHALEGSDSVTLYHVADNTSITVRGGSGDDTVEVGNGRLSSNLQGEVFLIESSGNDELIANDSLDNTVPEHPVTFQISLLGGLTHALYPTNTVGEGSVHFDPLINTVTLLSSDAADVVYVDAAPEGLLLFLGAGNDKLVYGGSGHVVPSLQPATIAGGDGFDDIIIDDSGGPSGTGRIYDFDETHVLNQTVSGFENLALNTRDSWGVLESHEIHFSGGFPVGDNITVRSPDGGDTVRIGATSNPIDLDDSDLIFTTETEGFVHLFDQDFNGSGLPFQIWDDGTPNNQRVDKGGFRGVFRQQFSPSLDIQGGSTNDIFEVSAVHPRLSMQVCGGGGDDVVQPGNRNGHQADIDAIFPFQTVSSGGYFEFDGEDGNDALYLDDNDDEVGDGDENYYVAISGQNGWVNLTKGTSAPPVIGFGLVEWDNIESIHLIGDDDNNTFYFDSLGGASLVLHGASGNDTFTNYDPNDGNGSLVNGAAGGALYGGLGNDTVTLDDSRNQLVDQYQFDATNLTFSSGASTWNFFTEAENISLDQNDALATSTILRSKPPATRLTFSGGGGGDTFIVGGGDIDNSGFSAATTTLLGGTGEDRIEFDDRLDDHNVSDADTFTFQFQQVTKDGTTIIYAGFESQKLSTSGVNNSTTFFPNTVRINAIDMPTEVVGTAGDRDNIVDVGSANLGISQLFGAIALDFAAAPVVVNVNDQIATADRLYDFTASGLVQPIAVSHSGVAALNLFAGSGHDTLIVNGVPAGMSVFFKGNNGDEFIFLGNGGPISDLVGRVFVNGDAGHDSLFIRSGGVAFTDAVLTSSSFTANGGPDHLYGTVERVQLTVNDAGSDIQVRSATAATTIVGGAGDDHVVVGGGDLDANITAAVHVGGGFGNDLVEFDDSADVPDANDNYILSGDEVADHLLRSTGNLTSVGVEQRVLHGNDGISLFRIFSSFSGLRVNANGGNDLLQVDATFGLVSVSSGAGVDFLEVNAGATVVIDQDDELNSLIVFPGGTLRVTSGAVLCNSPNPFSGSVEFFVGGTMDLPGGAFLSRAGPMAPTQTEFRGLLTTGRNGGTWNGTGGAINSSLAAASPLSDGVGYGLGSQIAPTTIGPFSIGPGDTLLRYTRDGDADLSGSVNLDDFNRLAGAFGQSGKVWIDADSNYDGIVNLDDFNMLAGNFGQSVAPGPDMLGFAPDTNARLRLEELA